VFDINGFILFVRVADARRARPKTMREKGALPYCESLAWQDGQGQCSRGALFHWARRRAAAGLADFRQKCPGECGCD